MDSQQMISPEGIHTFLYDSLFLSLSAHRPTTERGLSLPDQGSLARIASFMSKYLVETNFCVQKKESGRRLDSATLRMIENQGSCGAYDALTGELGDFALFISGIFPEYLEKRNQQAFYSGVGSAAYWQEFKRTTYDPFYRLAEEFDLFARVIRDARANMIEAENGKLLIPGVPDHPRYKVIFSGSDKTVVIDKSKN